MCTCVCASVVQVFVRLIASCLHIFHTHFAQFSSKLIESFSLLLLLLLFLVDFFAGFCVNDMLTAASGALELMSIISQSCGKQLMQHTTLPTLATNRNESMGDFNPCAQLSYAFCACDRLKMQRDEGARKTD